MISRKTIVQRRRVTSSGAMTIPTRTRKGVKLSSKTRCRGGQNGTGHHKVKQFRYCFVNDERARTPANVPLGGSSTRQPPSFHAVSVTMNIGASRLAHPARNTGVGNLPDRRL